MQHIENSVCRSLFILIRSVIKGFVICYMQTIYENLPTKKRTISQKYKFGLLRIPASVSLNRTFVYRIMELGIKVAIVFLHQLQTFWYQ